MPKASAPKAPWVLVWLSPQTIVSARQRQAQLGTDHMHDPLMAALDVVKRDAKLAAVGPHRLDLPARKRVADVELVVGRHVVVDRGERQVRPAHAPASRPKPSNAWGLVTSWTRWRSIYKSVASSVELDHVAIPDLLEQCFAHR